MFQIFADIQKLSNELDDLLYNQTGLLPRNEALTMIDNTTCEHEDTEIEHDDFAAFNEAGTIKNYPLTYVYCRDCKRYLIGKEAQATIDAAERYAEDMQELQEDIWRGK